MLFGVREGAVLSMLRGEPIALLVTAIYALLLASERIPWVRTSRAWPVLRELYPVLCVVFGIQCATHWFTAVSEIRPPEFIACLIVAVALALPTAAVTHARARRIVAGVSIALASFLALADALYYRFFGGIVPLLGASNMKQAWEVTSSIAALLMSRDLWFVALMGSGVWIAASRGYAAPSDNRRLHRLVVRGVLAAGVAAVVFLGFDLRSWFGSKDSVRIFSWRQKLHETGIYGAHVRDMGGMVRASRKAGEQPSQEKVDALGKYLEANAKPAPDVLFGAARGKNLIVIQVEALHQWVIDARVRGTEVTPFLNRLRRERALYFNGVWDQTMISPTADSEFLSLNSLQPMSDVAISFRFSDNDFVALPGLLAKKGYSTLSAHAFERGFWNRAKVHPRYGFQQLYFDRELGSGPKFGWGLPDKVFLQRALERVDKARPPFMAFFITLTSHHPYNNLPSAEVHIETAGLPEILAGYVASARYVDEALAAFFDALAKRPYGKDTMVVLYGDHESFITLDDGAREKALKVLSLDAQTLKDLAVRSFATRKIPFFVVLPDAKEPRTFEQVGGQIDFSPTLLHLLGLPQPTSMMGRPLVGSGGVVFRADGSAVEGDRMRLSDGSCRTLSGKGMPSTACDDLGKRGDEQVQVAWAITQYNLAERLARERSASR
jgi:phosphoglycerol transferase MdoB-like AlkP superfamily enzyme